jgi:membrane protein DedA with SNARE-associated domain
MWTRVGPGRSTLRHALAQPAIIRLLASRAAAVVAAAVTATAAHAAAPDGSAAPALTALQQAGVYLSLAFGPIVAEELAPLGAGLAASQGELSLSLAVVLMTLGGWLSTAALYGVGRWRGRWIRRRFPKAGAVVKRLLRAVRRRPWRSALAVRYAFGARVLLPLACGAAHVRPDVYLVATFVSSATWSLAFALVGYWFGETAIETLKAVGPVVQYVVGVAAGIAALVWLVFRRRRASRLAPPDGPER